MGLLLVCGLTLTGCGASGDIDDLQPPEGAGEVVEQQSVNNLLEAYRTALLQEDIDRLQVLFRPQEVASAPVRAFLDHITETFRTMSTTDIELQPPLLTADRRSVSFLEIQSLEDPAALLQQTRAFRTTFELDRTETAGIVTFRIAEVQREGPLVDIVTRGQLLAGMPTRVEVSGPSPAFVLSQVDVSVSATEGAQALERRGSRFQGVVTLPPPAASTALHVRVHEAQGERLEMLHRYRPQKIDTPVVQRINGTGATRFFALAVAADGTVWAGGDRGGRLYQVPLGSTTAQFVGNALSDQAGRIESLVFDTPQDRSARLHAVVFAPLQSGVIVVEPTPEGTVFCQTVNVFDPQRAPDPTYPFRV